MKLRPIRYYSLLSALVHGCNMTSYFKPLPLSLLHSDRLYSGVRSLLPYVALTRHFIPATVKGLRQALPASGIGK